MCENRQWSSRVVGVSVTYPNTDKLPKSLPCVSPLLGVVFHCAGSTSVVCGFVPYCGFAAAELLLMRSLDVSTASKALAGTFFSSETKLSVQRVSDVPWKNQLLPLSANTIPYVYIATSTDLAAGLYPAKL